MTILEQIQAKLKELNSAPVSNPVSLPIIRYFDGTETYCTPAGAYSSKTLEGSLQLFYTELCTIN